MPTIWDILDPVFLTVFALSIGLGLRAVCRRLEEHKLQVVTNIRSDNKFHPFM